MAAPSTPPHDRGERLDLVAAGVATTVAVGSSLAPRLLFRLFGLDPDRLTAEGAFGWRMFAVRTLAIAVLIARGERHARELAIAIQAGDQAVFVHAWRTGGIGARTFGLAMVASWTIVLTLLGARRRARGAVA